MYDEELAIAGMTDMLFYNVKFKCFQIWDWKTNKQLRTENKFQRLKGPLAMLEDCEMNIYSLQLHTYKYILKRKLGLNLGDCYIVWFNEKNPNYVIHKCYDFENVVPTMFENAA
jgi:ATP-dependent exoDNAse (exonuclease V) beta subunit